MFGGLNRKSHNGGFKGSVYANGVSIRFQCRLGADIGGELLKSDDGPLAFLDLTVGEWRFVNHRCQKNGRGQGHNSATTRWWVEAAEVLLEGFQNNIFTSAP